MLGDAVYPWGFPFLMSPFYALFGKNLFFLKIPVLICFSISLLFFHLLLKKHFSFFQAEILTLFIAINPVFVFFCNSPLSDIPFLCFSTVTIYFLDILLYETEKRKQIKSGFLAGLFAFFAFMIRANGIVFLCLFIVIHLLMVTSKEKKLASKLKAVGFTGFSKPCIAAHVLPYTLFFFLYMVQKLSLPQAGATYVNLLGLIRLKAILANCLYYSKIFKDFFPFNFALSVFLYSWLVVFFFYGFIRYALKYPVYSIYLLGVMGILILWPVTQGIRFCFPAIPLMIVFTGFGIKDFIRFVKDKRFYKAGLFIEVAAVLMCLCLYTYKGKYVSDEYGAYSKDAKQLYSFVMENTKEDEKIVFFKPRVLYLETGRLGFQVEANDIERLLTEADYLILSRGNYGAFNYDIESQYPEESKNLTKIFENDALKMYRINNCLKSIQRQNG